MSQKWSNLSDNLLDDYHLHSERTSQLQNVTANSSHQSSIENQKNSSEELMISSGHFIVPSDSTKKLCLSTSECSIPKDTCRDILEAEQVVGGEYQSIKEKYNPNPCFVCLCETDENNYISIKESSKHSFAPLVVLLMDVLGYSLETDCLHSKAVCRSCYQLLDTIDELQQTLTESKTNLRRKFFETFQKLKLKYSRTDKIIKTQCLRCSQMNHRNSRKKKRCGRIVKEKNNLVRNSKLKIQVNEDSFSGEENQKDGRTIVDVDSENYNNHFKNSETPENLICLEESDNINIFYDTDPKFFSPDEKLKAGYMKSNGESSLINCCHCTAQYDSSLSVKMHVRVFHMPVIIYDNGQGITGSRHRIGMKLKNISNNERFSLGKSYCCLFCVSSFKLEGSLQFHFRENHSPHKPYQCLNCKEQFRKSLELSKHRVYGCPLRKLDAFENKG